jgi:hypothetical protein
MMEGGVSSGALEFYVTVFAGDGSFEDKINTMPGSADPKGIMSDLDERKQAVIFAASRGFSSAG